MAVTISKPSLNLRSELSTLKGQIHRLLNRGRMQEFWFSNLVTNGTFDSDSDWTKGTDWAIAANVATKTPGSVSSLGQEVSVLSHRRYKVSVTTAMTTNTFDAYMGTVSSTNQLLVDNIPNGVSSHIFINSGNYSYFSIYANSLDNGTIDDISLFEVDADDEVIYTLPPGWKPLFVDEEDSGPLKKDTHYTIEYNGTYYYVKPTTQPTAASPAWRVTAERIV